MPIYSVPGLISIHAPREGSDTTVKDAAQIINISIHAPREGSDQWTDGQYYAITAEFLSTLPARGATQLICVSPGGKDDFYPRSPRGERPVAFKILNVPFNFYPRSPRGERQAMPPRLDDREEFLSTLPARGATLS